MSARDGRSWGGSPTLPASHFVAGSVYTDPQIHADEVRELFGRLWRFACHESELPNTFDYRVFDHAGQSLFCIRGEDNRIRTFINACSHRGAKLLNQPRGNAGTITCFYHHWRYDDRGSCVGIPRPAAYDATGPRRQDMGLREVRTEVKFGLVFVNLNDDTESLETFLAGVLDTYSSVLGEIPLEVFHYSRAELDANWKAWHETNMDTYHENMHVVLRKTQLNAMGMKDRVLELFDNGHAASGALKAQYEGYAGFVGRGSDVPPLPGLTGTDFRYVDLFPSTTIIVRGSVVRIDTATPLAPGRTLLEMRGLGVKDEPENHRRIRTNHYNQYWGPFGRNVPEDMFAAEACADSFRHGAARYQIIARDEGLTGQDDGILRGFYAEWGRRLNRLPSAPAQEWDDGS